MKENSTKAVEKVKPQKALDAEYNGLTFKIGKSVYRCFWAEQTDRGILIHASVEGKYHPVRRWLRAILRGRA